MTTPPNPIPAGKTVIPLHSLALVKVSGDDAQEFLQGQLSNDVDALEPGRCQLNAYCNPKGRVLALIRLARWGEGFGIVLPGELADGFVARLKMFVLRAQVVITPQPQGLWGALNDDGGGGDDGVRVAVDGIVPRHLLIGEADGGNTGGDNPPNDDLWRLVDILSGIPQVYARTTESFIPQMLNLDCVAGLSFTKGCYPGQEIVARLRYLGRVKQRLFVAEARAAKPLAPGDPVYAGEQKVGQLVDAVQTGDRQYTVSATAQASRDDAATLRVGAPSAAAGAALSAIALPYALPAE